VSDVSTVKISAVIDTTIIVDYFRQNPNAKAWFAGQAAQQSAITPVIWMEAVQGARDKIERAQIMRFLRQFRMEHPTSQDNNWAMLQLGRFHLSHGVEYPDIMIASVAVRLGVPLYTLNIKHFAPLPNLDERQPY
jgi:predicted nucleic acid-binding protein